MSSEPRIVNMKIFKKTLIFWDSVRRLRRLFGGGNVQRGLWQRKDLVVKSWEMADAHFAKCQIDESERAREREREREQRKREREREQRKNLKRVREPERLGWRENLWVYSDMGLSGPVIWGYLAVCDGNGWRWNGQCSAMMPTCDNFVSSH